ncbi:helix-turn-helix domain-containing protein [Listeria ilorinensis]|uniref:helix-turn-helix domain-containing protein n=1 Tax=Listeria ilorinensis TaxID=2867439 RepID=UPI001EF4550B|nr:helix-turn-helix transcriptional regulator [Listeria ilorinensis]
MAIGKKIAELRNKRGLSQSQLSKLLNVATSTVGMWETEKRALKDADIVKIANFFNVSTDYLLGGTINNSTPPSNSDSFEAFKNNPDLAAWWRNLPESDEEKLQQLKEMWEIIN